MPRNFEMWWRASTSTAPPASFTISSEWPTDWISIPGAAVSIAIASCLMSPV